MHIGKFLLALSSGFTAIPAIAQDTPANSDARSTSVEEIIVTAQRREESLQKIPIAISTVSGDLASRMGVKDSSDLQMIAPAVTINQNASGAVVTIRGVGASGSSADEAANAIYIDGVYQAHPQGLIFSLNNIERVEVAKGPQGTLFGRNSTGGVIQLITKDPSQDVRADLSLGYGNYDTITARAYVTGGLAENLAADIAVSYENQRDGWGTNFFNGRDLHSGKMVNIRTKLKWEASDATTVKASYMHSYLEPPASQGASILFGERTLGTSTVPGTAYTGLYNANFDGALYKRAKQDQASLTVEHDLGWARAVNIAAYTRTILRFGIDADAGPAPVVQLTGYNPLRAISEEFQLLSPSGSKVKWSLGLYYFQNVNGLEPLVFSGATAQLLDSVSTVNSYSAYGQTTVPLGSTTNITAGIRYTIDKRKLDYRIERPIGTVLLQASPRTTDKKPTFRLSIDQRLGDQFLAYVSYNRGYKSGLYNNAVPNQPSIGPEIVDAYELGLKSQLFDNHVQLNLAAFYYDFNDIQLRITNSTGTSVIASAAKAKIKGIDGDFIIKPVSNFTLTGGFTYLKTEYKEFPNSPFFTVLPTGGLSQFVGNASGNNVILSPKFVGSLTSDYRIPVSFGEISISGNATYNSGFYFDPQNRVRQGAYTLLNATMGWTSTDGMFSVQGWAKNITNRGYLSYVTTATVGDQFWPGAPRTYGMTLSVHY